MPALLALPVRRRCCLRVLSTLARSRILCPRELDRSRKSSSASSQSSRSEWWTRAEAVAVSGQGAAARSPAAAAGAQAVGVAAAVEAAAAVAGSVEAEEEEAAEAEEVGAAAGAAEEVAAVEEAEAAGAAEVEGAEVAAAAEESRAEALVPPPQQPACRQAPRRDRRPPQRVKRSAAVDSPQIRSPGKHLHLLATQLPTIKPSSGRGGRAPLCGFAKTICVARKAEVHSPRL